MGLQRGASMVMGGIFMLFFFAGVGMQFYGGALVTAHGFKMGSALRGPSDPLAGVIEVSGHKDTKGRVLTDYHAFASHAEMVDGRSIRVRSTVPIKALLKRGEKAPTTDMADLLVESRAHILAEKECELVNKSLAAKCAVDYATGKADAKGRMASLSMRLQFVPKAERGVLPETAGRFVAVREKLDTKPGGTRTTVGSAAKLRARYYKKAADLCAKLRRREGNCSITGMSVGPGYSSDKGYALTGQATFGMLSGS